jgi:hypothetical protein
MVFISPSPNIISFHICLRKGHVVSFSAIQGTKLPPTASQPIATLVTECRDADAGCLAFARSPTTVLAFAAGTCWSRDESAR